MQEQLGEYFSDLLSKYQCDFMQGYGTQNCLSAMIEKPRKIKDKKDIFASLQIYQKSSTTSLIIYL